jgi:NADPH:quinone reductase-like Zn-dependent oxidoreductase
MKARVKSRPEPGLEFTVVPPPKPGANGVLVRVREPGLLRG